MYQQREIVNRNSVVEDIYFRDVQVKKKRTCQYLTRTLLSTAFQNIKVDQDSPPCPR